MKRILPEAAHGKIFLSLFIVTFAFHIKAQRPVFKQIDIPKEIHSINCLLFDNNLVWLATAKGLYSYDGTNFNRFFEEQQPELYQINTFTKDANNILWLGTYKGILVKFTKGKILNRYEIKPLSKSDNYLINSISVDKNKTGDNPEILLTTAGGEIFAVDTLKNEVKKIKSPAEGTIYSIQYGYSPTVWLATSDGFYTMTKNSKWKKKSGLSNAYGLVENNGKYWAIGRNEESEALLMLYYNNRNDNSPKHYVWKDFDLSKLSNRYTRFYELGFTRGEITWIASSEGLIRYNPITASTKLFNKNKKLDLKNIRHIAVQNNNLFWISSSGKRFFRVELK